MKKLLFSVALVACISGAAVAYADAENVKSTLYNTDILTYLDGIPIQGFSLGGKMMICVEDLRDYGYTVTYDDSARVLFANKTGEPDPDFHPQIERGTVGGIAGYTYYTDIYVYINGIHVYAENIGGRMVVIAEDISDAVVQDYGFGHTYYNLNSEYGVSEFFLKHHYDNSERALYIETASDNEILSYDDQIKRFLNGEPRFSIGDPTYAKPKIWARIDTENCTMFLYSWQWITSIAKFYKNGIYMDMYDVFMHYHFQNQRNTTISSGEFSADGSICYIDGMRYKYNGLLSYTLIDEGTYEVDTDAFTVKLKE